MVYSFIGQDAALSRLRGEFDSRIDRHKVDYLHKSEDIVNYLV